MTAKRVCVVLTTRGNYAKMKSTLDAARADPRLAMEVAVGGALLDPAYGDYTAVIKADGFAIDGSLDYITGAATPEDVAESAGRCTVEAARLFARLKPDIVLVIADRYEALSIAHAALCGNIPIAHLEGGEVSGSMDERIRHAITKLAQLHFPANQAAAQRLRRLGELDESIHVVGTPSLDLLEGLDLSDTSALAATLGRDGAGAAIDLDKPYIVVSQHPVGGEFSQAPEQFAATAEAVRGLGLPTVWIRPNDEAGAGALDAPLAVLMAGSALPLRSVGSLRLIDYAVLLHHARCLLGNSSSGLREGAFLGVPAVNIGSRQNNRQRGRNVVDVAHRADAIIGAAERQIAHGRYDRDTLYGDGAAGAKIVNALATTSLELDKALPF